MNYRITFQQSIKRPISSVGTLITNDSLGYAKYSKDILLKEFHNHFSIIGPCRDDLYQLRNLTHY